LSPIGHCDRGIDQGETWKRSLLAAQVKNCNFGRGPIRLSFSPRKQALRFERGHGLLEGVPLLPDEVICRVNIGLPSAPGDVETGIELKSKLFFLEAQQLSNEVSPKASNIEEHVLRTRPRCILSGIDPSHVYGILAVSQQR
jgi:hypothetical protein